MHPRINTGVHVRDIVVREIAAHSHTDTRNHQPRNTTGRQVQHRHEQTKEHNCRTKVLLEHQNTQAHNPRQEHRCQITQTRQIDRADAAASHQNQVTVCRQIAGEENRQSNLRDLTRLERSVTDMNPNTSTIELHTQTRNQRHDKQDHRQHQGGVRDLTQQAVIPEHEHDNRAQHHRHAGPHQLTITHRSRNLRIQTINHGQTNTVQGHHQRQNKRISITGAELHDQVNQKSTGTQHHRARQPLALRRIKSMLRINQVHAEGTDTYRQNQQEKLRETACTRCIRLTTERELSHCSHRPLQQARRKP